MKKIMLVMICGMVFLVVGSAFAKSEWAKYKVFPVPYEELFKFPSLEAAMNEDDTINCCQCHGMDTGHDGPTFPYCADEKPGK